eukprot:4569999-Pyramimonas_sp.AAC.1
MAPWGAREIVAISSLRVGGLGGPRVDGECTQHKVQVPPCWPSDFALEVRSRLGRRQDEPFRDCPKERGSPVPISLTQ